MKKYYCPTCNKFKRRYELKSELIGYETYGLFCKWCHNRVYSTESVLEKILKGKVEE